MKCKCGGLMQLRQLTMDTDAYVCVLCGRDDIPRKAAPVDEPDDIPVPPPKPVPPPTTHKKETTTMGYYGTCTTCNRGPLSLQYKDTCARCHKRIAKGKDPLTGEKIESTNPSRLVISTAGIEGETGTEPCKKIIQLGLPPAGPPDPGFTLDVMAAIDEAWLGKRAAIITQLQAATKTAEKLRIAFFTLASVNAMGTEA